MMMRNNSEASAPAPIGDTRTEAWVAGDIPGRVARSSEAAEACGLRVLRSLSIDEALAVVPGRSSGPLVLVDIGDQLSLAEAELLDLLDRQADDSRTAVIVVCAHSTLDAVAACIAAPFAAILCDPTGIDRILAICTAMPLATGVAETDRTAEALRLLQLTDEIARIARALADVPHDEGIGVRGVSDGFTGYRAAPLPALAQVTAIEIRSIIRWRRRRDTLISSSFFADPVWDMMLDLAAARIERTEVSVSSLCIAAAVPATTALRWIKGLTEAGIFVRVADPNDRRRVYIRLADGIATALFDFLGAAKGAGAGLI